MKKKMLFSSASSLSNLTSVSSWSSLSRTPIIHFKVFIPSSWQCSFVKIMDLCRTTSDVIVLLAPEGGGKTTYVTHFFQGGMSRDQEQANTFKDIKRILINAEPQDTFATLMKKVATCFGQPWGNESTFEILLNKNTNFVMAIDNADSLSQETLMALLAWSKLEKKSKNFNLVLTALPGFEEKLLTYPFLPQVQNVLQAIPIDAFSKIDILSFIKWMNFTPMNLEHDDVTKLFDQSLGNPKKLQQLIQKTLFSANKKSRKVSVSKKKTGRIATSFKQVFFTFENKGGFMKSFFQILICGTVLGLGLGCAMIYYFYMHEDAIANSGKITSEVKLDLIPKAEPNLQQFLEPMLDLHHAAGEASKPMHPVLSPVDEDRDIEAEENKLPEQKPIENKPKDNSNTNSGSDRQAFLESTEQAFYLAKSAIVTTDVKPQVNPEPVSEPIPTTESAPVSSLPPVVEANASVQAPVQSLAQTSSPQKTDLDLDLDDLVLSKSKNHYSLQILGTQSYSEMMSVYKQHQGSINLVYANTPQEEGNWYILLAGDYATREEAVAALAQLPAEFKKNSPWIRSWGNVHEQMIIHH